MKNIGMMEQEAQIDLKDSNTLFNATISYNHYEKHEYVFKILDL